MRVLLFTLALCALTKHVQSWSSDLVSRRDAGSAVISTVMMTSIYPALAETGDVDSDGYITTSRGIKYKVTKAPDDPNSDTPARAQKVKAKYTLYLNGFPEDTDKASKIDSSKGFLGEKPFEFLAGVSQVIKGVS